MSSETLRWESRARRPLLLLSPLLVAAATFTAHPAFAAAPGVTCSPSPDCALEMAQAHGGVDALVTRGRILEAVARHGSPAQLDALIEEWREEFQRAWPAAPDNWRFASAHALAIAGRDREAIAQALELGPGNRRTVMVDVAVELAVAGRLAEATGAVLRLPADDGQDGARLELLIRLLNHPPPVPSLPVVAQMLGYDVKDPSTLAAYPIAKSELERGNAEFARRMSEAERGTAAVERLLDFANIEMRGERWESARSFLAKAQLRTAEIKDARLRGDYLGSVAEAWIDARAPREALPLMKHVAPDVLPERQATLVAQLAWLDLPAARLVFREIKTRNSWQFRHAQGALASAEIAANPGDRAVLAPIEFPRLKGHALQDAAEQLAASGDAKVARALLEEAATFIESDPDRDGRDLTWDSIAKTWTEFGSFDTAYSVAEKISSAGHRVKVTVRIAVAQAKLGDAKAARARCAAALSAARAANAVPSAIADAAAMATQAGFLDEAHEALISLVARDASGANRLDEPNLSDAKRTTAIALAQAGSLDRAFGLANTIGYRPDVAFVAIYEALRPTGAAVSLLKQSAGARPRSGPDSVSIR